MESKRSSGNCAYANLVAVAAGHGSNVGRVAQDLGRAVIGERYFAGSFLENELAQLPKDIGQFKS
jgi:hypothetical protein